MRHVSPITGEYVPFFVTTNERTERFVTKDAAQAFMELHCSPWCHDSGAERIVVTNAIS